MGNSSSHVVYAAASSSGGGLFTLFPCSSVGSFPWETVLHELLQHEFFPRGAVLQEQAAPGWVPHGVTSPASKLLQRGLLSPRGHRSCQEPAPAWASHRVTTSFGHPPALTCGPPQAAGGSLLHHGPPWVQGTAASPWAAPQAAGESLLWLLEHLLPLLLH